MNIRGHLITVLGILTTSVCFSQSLLWEVSHPSKKHTGYLYGTMHINNSSVTEFSPVVLEALEKCEMFACEIDLEDIAPSAELIGMIMMKDSTLSDLLSKEQYKLVNDSLVARLGAVSAAFVVKFKPIYISAMFETDGSSRAAQESGEAGGTVDEKLIRLARGAGLVILSLETMDEASAAIDKISLHDQAVMVYEMLADSAVRSDADKLFDLYIEQDLDGMFQSYESQDLPDAVGSSLLNERNQRFAEKLTRNMKKKSVFCAVGALHLPGETGLIATLRKNGFVVKPVLFSWPR